MIQTNVLSLLNSQKQAFHQVLNPEVGIPWKILNYDTYCQNILSTLYRVGDLREMCITLHFNLNQEREKLHGVVCIYLVQPTQASYDKIIEDFQRDLYSKVIINFCSTPNLEYLAKELGKIGGAVQKIQKIYSNNIDFISLNHNFFAFNNEQRLIVNNLFSMIITLKVQPLIIYQKDKKLEQVAKELIERLKTIDINSEYPILALVLPDRDDDLNPLIMHSNTYGALMHDIHKIENNKVTYDKQVYDLSPAYDQIWAESCNLPYPDATDKIDNELTEWNKQYQIITTQNSEISNALNAIDLVPQMNQQKKIIEAHVNLAKSILTQAKSRQLDKFYQIGQSIIQGEQFQLNFDNIATDDQIMESHKQMDRLRLLILMLLNNCPQFQKSEQQLQLSDEKYKRILQNVKNKIGYNQQQSAKTVQTKFKSIFNNIASKVQNHSKGILKNMQSFLNQREKKFAIVQLIENLFNNDFKSDELMAFFEIYDNKTKSYINSEIGLLSSIKDILICFVDGGCYNEYAELSDYAKTINKNIIYGGNKIFTAENAIELFN